ncbi:MAG: hypothetical protein ACKO63_12860 [Nodosilinea sp.]
MGIQWSRAFRQPQTYLLLLGTGLGYALLLNLAGPRPLVWAGGGAIATTMVASWLAGWRPPANPPLSGDLLDRQSFIQHLESLSQGFPSRPESTWRQAYTWALESQAFAHQIYQRDPLLQVDLLEALHTVVDLARQVAEGLAVVEQVQTPTYRQLAQQRLTASCDRLQATRAQLQQLQDQVTLASLDPETGSGSLLPQGLQTLIAANRDILERNHPGQ